MTTYPQRFINSVKQKPWFIILSVLIVLASSLITISTTFSLVRNGYDSTLGDKGRWLKKIEQLTPEANIEYFKQIIGYPIFINERSGGKEYVFLNDYSIIDALTDKDDKVLAFSVTTRQKHFNPVLKLGPFSTDTNETTITLGKSTFSDLDSLKAEPNIMLGVGAHNYHYDEEYYLGNPSNYQSYIFSMNQNGDLNEDDVPPIDTKLSLDDIQIRQYRDKAIINTYTITSPFSDSETLGVDQFGAQYDQMRIVPDFFKYQKVNKND